MGGEPTVVADETERGRGAPGSAGRRGGTGARPDWWSIAGLVLVHVVLALMVFDPTPHSGGDNAAYLALARALVEQGAYIELWDPATPLHTQYPPVVPALLALARLVGLDSWVAFKLVIVACSAGAVALTYLFLRRWSGHRFALGVAAIAAIAPGVLELSHWVLSDLPFWAFTMLALWGFERARAGHRDGFALGLAGAVLAFFTRSAGLPLVLAAVGGLALRRRWRQVAIFAAVGIPLAALWWLYARAGGGVSYVDQWLAVNPYAPELGRIGPLDFAGRVVENGRRYLGLLLPRVLTGSEHGLLFVPAAAFVGLAVFGWVGRLRSAGVAELFFPLYIGLLVAWPAVWAGARFIVPVLPLLLAYAGEAVIALTRRIRPRLAATAGATAALGMILAGATALYGDVQNGLACTSRYLAEGEEYPCPRGRWVDVFELGEWSRDALPGDAVVISRKPRLFHALSDRTGRTYPMRDDPQAFFDLARETGARYLLLARVDRLWELYLSPVLMEHADRFCIMRSLGSRRATLFGIQEATDPTEADEARGPDEQETTRQFPPCPDAFWSPALRGAEPPAPPLP